MKFIDIAGTTGKARRYPAASANVQDLEVKDPAKLAEIIRELSRRVSELEARLPPEGIEIELDVASGDEYRLYHGLNCSVRYYIVHRQHDAGVGSSNIAVDCISETTDNNHLGFEAHGTGRIILRIEPSQYYFTPDN